MNIISFHEFHEEDFEQLIETTDLLGKCLLRWQIKWEVGSFSHKLIYGWSFFCNHSKCLLVRRQNAGSRHFYMDTYCTVKSDKLPSVMSLESVPGSLHPNLQLNRWCLSCIVGNVGTRFLTRKKKSMEFSLSGISWCFCGIFFHFISQKLVISAILWENDTKTGQVIFQGSACKDSLTAPISETTHNLTYAQILCYTYQRKWAQLAGRWIYVCGNFFDIFCTLILIERLSNQEFCQDPSLCVRVCVCVDLIIIPKQQ